MRIFEEISYNLNQIKFKENYGFLTSLLDEHGISYPDLGFHFSHTDKAIEKIKSKIPALARYCGENVFSSTLSDGTNYLAEEEKSDFLALLGKVPHSYNFGFMTVILDNIDWYGNGAHSGVNLVEVSEAARDIFDARYYSNHIRFRKHFDYLRLRRLRHQFGIFAEVVDVALMIIMALPFHLHNMLQGQGSVFI